MYLGVEPYLRRSAQSSRVVALTLSSQSGALAASTALRAHALVNARLPPFECAEPLGQRLADPVIHPLPCLFFTQ